MRIREQKSGIRSFISRERLLKIEKAQLIKLIILAGAIIAGIAVIAGLVAHGNIESSFLARAETIRVGMRTDIAGFGQVGESGEIEGFDADVAREVVTRVLGEEKPMEFVALNSEDAGAAIKYGKADIAIGFLAEETERVSAFVLSNPYYTENIQAAVADPSITSLSSLDGKNVGILNSMIPLTFANDYLDALNISADITRYFSLDDAAFDLESGHISAFFAPQSILKQYLPSFGRIGEPVAQISYGILMPSSQGAVQKAINEAIRSMKRDGTMESLAQKWGLPYES